MELSTETRRAMSLNANHGRPHIVVEETAKGQNVNAFGTAIVADAFAETVREMGGTEVAEFDLSAGRGSAFNAQAYSIARKRSGV
jgi:hypothetical protein